MLFTYGALDDIVIPIGARLILNEAREKVGIGYMQKIVKLGIQGVGQGLLMHNPAGMQAAPEGPTRSGKKIPKPLEEATAALYVVPGTNQLGAAADWFREAALVAAKEFKDTSRRGNATMVQRFSASVFQAELFFPLFWAATGKPLSADYDVTNGDWEMYLKRVVVQGNGIVRSRPLIPNRETEIDGQLVTNPWSCTIEFEYDTEAISPEMIAPIVNGSGKYPGVGDYRPGKKGPFGRFQVVTLDGASWAPASS